MRVYQDTVVRSARHGIRFQQTNSTKLAVSSDGSCGSESNQTCLTSTFGSCCSSEGICGSTAHYCTTHCQPNHGECTTNSSFISLNGECGVLDSKFRVCTGSSFGSCCGENGYCGSNATYCGAGCQPNYGTCIVNNRTTLYVSSLSIANLTSLTPNTTNIVSATAAQQPTSARFEAAGISRSATSSPGSKTYVGVPGAILVLTLIGLVINLVHKKRKGQLVPQTADQSELNPVLESEPGPPNHQPISCRHPSTPIDVMNGQIWTSTRLSGLSTYFQKIERTYTNQTPTREHHEIPGRLQSLSRTSRGEDSPTLPPFLTTFRAGRGSEFGSDSASFYSYDAYQNCPLPDSRFPPPVFKRKASHRIPSERAPLPSARRVFRDPSDMNMGILNERDTLDSLLSEMWTDASLPKSPVSEERQMVSQP